VPSSNAMTAFVEERIGSETEEVIDKKIYVIHNFTHEVYITLGVRDEKAPIIEDSPAGFSPSLLIGFLGRVKILTGGEAENQRKSAKGF
jgi:hypothetical protein